MSLRVRPRQQDFTAGELGPALGGRVDLDRYFRGCKVLENFIILPGGGVQRRPGTRYVATALGRARLIRFEVSTEQAYLLAFTAGKIQIFRNSARLENPPGTPVEVTTTYTEAELAELRIAQSADVLIVCHPTHPPARLDRLSPTVFRLRDIHFVVPPSFEHGARPTVSITPGAVNGNGIACTLSGAYAKAADIGREIIVTAGASNGAHATITAVPDPTHYTANITEPFADLTVIASGSWTLSDSPMTPCTPDKKGPVGDTAVLTAGAAAWRSEDVGKFVHLNEGVYEITGLDGVTPDTKANAKIRGEATVTTAAPADAWTLEEAAWSAANGYPRVPLFSVEDRLYFFSSKAQPHQAWGSKSGDFFNFALGALGDDALEFVLNTNTVNAIMWAEETDALICGTAGGEFTTDAGEGAVLTPNLIPTKARTRIGAPATIAPVRPGSGSAVLFPSRSRRRLHEFVFSFDENRFTAPDLTLLAEHVTKPVMINQTRISRAMTDLAYQREPISTVWAPRDDGVLLGLTYLRDQNIVGWHRHVTGTSASGSATDPDGQQIPAADDGIVESVAVIPHPNGDREQVWLAVRRTVNGAIVRHIEFLDDGGLNFEYLNTDATLLYDGRVTTATVTPGATSGTGVTFTASANVFGAGDVGKEIRVLGARSRATITAVPDALHVIADIPAGYEFANMNPIAAGGWGLAAFTFSGLNHLEGKAVHIVADGAAIKHKVVTAGAVALDDLAAVLVEIGLAYTSRLVPVRPEIPTAVGTSQGVPKGWGQIILRLLATAGGKINGQPINLRTGAQALNAPPLIRNKDVALHNYGIDPDGQITITQEDPLPMTVLMITGVLGVGID